MSRLDDWYKKTEKTKFEDTIEGSCDDVCFTKNNITTQLREKDGRTATITTINGELEVFITNSINREPEKFDFSEFMWKQYQCFRSGDGVIRSGFGMCGIYHYDDNEPIVNDYRENVTMHAASAVWIAYNFLYLHPREANIFFTDEERRRILTLLFYHDVGENLDGDVPDNGSDRHKNKEVYELSRFFKLIAHLPINEQRILLKDICAFEHADKAYLSVADARIAQFAKLCDKFEAIFSAILFEKKGRAGDVLKEGYRMTETIRSHMNSVKSSSTVDVWLARTISGYSHYVYFSKFLKIALYAIEDVRGEECSWINSFLIESGDTKLLRELHNKEVFNDWASNLLR